jgi:competence protein ComFB
MMSIHNLMEDIVRNCLKELLNTQPHLSGCDEQCQSDVLAIVLNRMPAKYVSTIKGEVFAKTQIGPQTETDVYRELSYALDKVLNNARPSLFDKND